jgi:hypothetical protein
VFATLNSLFVLVGMSVVAFAIWAAVGKSRTGITLAVTVDAAYALLVVGSVLTLVSFAGCCGSIKKSRGLLVAYSVTVLLLLVGESVLVGLAFTDNAKSVKAVGDIWTHMSPTDRCDIQKALLCTGFANPADRPATPCNARFATGCAAALEHAVDRNMHTITGTLIGLGVFQLLLFFAGVFLAVKAKAAAAAPKYTRLVANDA